MNIFIKVNYPETYENQKNPCEQITKAIITSANTSIPKSSNTIKAVAMLPVPVL